MRHLVEMLVWGWKNGRREQLIALIVSIVAYVATIFVNDWFVSAIWLAAIVYTVAWGRGHRRGFDASQTIQLDGAIEAMEQVCAQYEEHLAPHHPEREAASQHLAYLRHRRREID